MTGGNVLGNHVNDGEADYDVNDDNDGDYDSDDDDDDAHDDNMLWQTGQPGTMGSSSTRHSLSWCLANTIIIVIISIVVIIAVSVIIVIIRPLSAGALPILSS